MFTSTVMLAFGACFACFSLGLILGFSEGIGRRRIGRKQETRHERERIAGFDMLERRA